ncbi:MAG TPA: vitamin B12 dependent-methionine synthase activation domain-containing protein [Prolixibacteraceae bacterium]|nr:vitamin B12 dependent-methionine synthase activation domain-containing protein [Prolixibacteraceae bacterium]
MIHEISYSFSQLNLDLEYLNSMLGFAEGPLPEPFGQYVEQALEQSAELCDIHAAFCFPQKCEFNASGNLLIVDGREFGIGKTVAKELRNISSVAFFICTAGPAISHRSAELLKGEDPVLGYVFDVLGSMIVEASTDLLQQEILREAAQRGYSITNRYSPGYCQWSVADQQKLFSFFPEGGCGIRLSNSSLMSPVKSVSGLIGMGEEVTFREYTCDLCTITECFHKSHHRNKVRVL